jgi:putative hydrolase of the HAD superfamily
MSLNSFNRIDIASCKGVLVDIDDTLYDYSASHSKAIEACCSAFSKLSFEEFNNRYITARKFVTLNMPKGVCRSRFFAFEIMFREMSLKSPYVLASSYENLYWDTFTENMRLAEGVFDFLQRCKCYKIPVCALSDMQTRFQVQKLKVLKLTLLIDYLVCSEEVGDEKPSPKMFIAGLDRLRICAQDAIMVGNDELKDIKGANSLGIRAFRAAV